MVVVRENSVSNERLIQWSVADLRFISGVEFHPVCAFLGLLPTAPLVRSASG